MDRFAERYLGTVQGKHGLNHLLWEDKYHEFCKLNVHRQNLIENFAM